MLKISHPNFIPKLDEIRRPIYIRTPLSSTLQEERLAGFIFSSAVIASLNKNNRTMVINRNFIWPNNNMAKSKIRGEYRRMSVRLITKNFFEIDTQQCVFLDPDIKYPIIQVYENISHDLEYNLFIRFTPAFVSLIRSTRVKTANKESTILGDISIIKWAKRRVTINFYWRICGWQTVTDQMSLTVKEFLEVINSPSKKFEIWRVKAKYILPIQRDLANSSAAFDFNIRTVAKQKFLVFKFKTNHELNTRAQAFYKPI